MAPRQAAAVAGVLSGACGLAVAELAAVPLGAASSPVVAVGATAVDLAPPALKDFAVAAFGTYDKLVLLAGVLLVLASASAALGVLGVRRPGRASALTALLGGIAAAAALTRPDSTLADAVPSVLGAAAGIVSLRAMTAPLGRAATGQTLVSGDAPPGFDRRAFLIAAASTGTVAATGGGLSRALSSHRYDAAAARAAVRVPVPDTPARPLPRGYRLAVPGLSPFFTPNRDFYRIDTALVVPKLTAAEWRLRVTGMVQREVELTFEDLVRLPLEEHDITLACVSNEVGGDYVGTARWIGVPIRHVLGLAGVGPEADQLLSRSVDGMTIGTPVAALTPDRPALLAVAMNGEPLPVAHGFPVRMVVSGLYGYVSATKWVTELRLTRFADVDAYWVPRGWAAQGPVKTMSRIDTPRRTVERGRVAVAGVAWAQHRGISAVEVRVDGGPWHAATLSAEVSVDAWRQWVWQWDAEPGRHRLEVRATDGDGRAQTGATAEPAPDGASGWHRRDVEVR